MNAHDYAQLRSAAIEMALMVSDGRPVIDIQAQMQVLMKAYNQYLLTSVDTETMENSKTALLQLIRGVK